ncbi:hypothetical protein [Nitrosopumilus sp.]|uniref:hypothetical protein n=1 Tax=Nitrosopumilus sp. TaxID=2024843 RepID=UPI0034A07C72
MGDDWRGWKDGKYDNRYKGVKHRNKKNNKAYFAIVIAGIAVLVAVIVNANYDITYEGQKIEEVIPVESIKSTIGKISDSIPVESIENTMEGISEKIPVKIEPKSEITETESQKQTRTYPPVTLKMDNKPSGGVTADFTINKVQVTDSDYYKIININILMTLHMKLDDMIVFSPTAMWILKSPDGEIYAEQCHGRQYDGKMITGKQNPNMSWDICFHVEKDLNKFDLMKESSKIGTIILD